MIITWIGFDPLISKEFEPAARRHRLLLVGNLVGEAVAWREAGIDDRETRDDHEVHEAEKGRTAHHVPSDPVAEAAKRRHARITGVQRCSQARLVADEEHAECGNE